MSLDVAVVGLPFLDLTFDGLPRLPRVGEEILARSLHVGPGGTGVQAIGAARLGLSVAIVAPLGRTGAARLVRDVLEHEGVMIVDGAAATGEGSDGEVPVTALLATRSGVAMASAPGGAEPRPQDVAATDARAVVVSLGRLHLAPRSAPIYAVTGGLELDHVDDRSLSRLSVARALILNASEAAALSGRDESEEAALELARRVPIAVVTMGAEGVLAAAGHAITRARPPRVDVVDATGAGDLFVSAYVWADLAGAPLGERLAWASLYAALSVRAATAFAGAVTRDALVAKGRIVGLSPPVPRPAT